MSIVQDKIAAYISMNMEKTAVDLKTLPMISKPFKVFRHPFSRIAKYIGLGRFLPEQSQLLSSGAKSISFGRNTGIHIGYDPYKEFQNILPRMSSMGADISGFKPLSRSGRKALKSVVTAHEGIEMHTGKKLLGNISGDKTIPFVSETRPEQLKGMFKNISSAAHDAVAKPINAINSFTKGVARKVKSYVTPSAMSTVSVGHKFSPTATSTPMPFRRGKLMLNSAGKIDIFRNAPKLRATPPMPSPIATPAPTIPQPFMNKMDKIMESSKNNSYFSHYHPDVLLQEGNILSTLKGRGAAEASDYMRKIRNLTGEAQHINRVAKKIGMNDYEYGVTRISRHKRKLLGNAILDDLHPKTINDNSAILDAMS